MELFPITTPLLRPNDDLATILMQQIEMRPGDIVVISSKAVATVEDAFIRLADLTPSAEAETWSAKTRRSPHFCEAVLRETARLGGTIVGHCPGAIVTEVRPSGLGQGSILTANAGLDESNVPDGTALGWPVDPLKSTSDLRKALGENVAVIVSDSCLRPRRRGVVAFALTVSGIAPIRSEIGKEDLFGHPLRVTNEATADQLATAANFLMGNAAQSTPACVIRDHGIPMTATEGWVPAIEPEEDLFRGIV